MPVSCRHVSCGLNQTGDFLSQTETPEVSICCSFQISQRSQVMSYYQVLFILLWKFLHLSCLFHSSNHSPRAPISNLTDCSPGRWQYFTNSFTCHLPHFIPHFTPKLIFVNQISLGYSLLIKSKRLHLALGVPLTWPTVTFPVFRVRIWLWHTS